MTNLNYEKSLQLLTSSGKFRIKLGLERICAILDLLGNPQDKIKVIHIAGTNGKGSVSSMIAEILRCSGYKTALYTSPHLFEYTERFKINGVDISKEKFSEYIEKVERLAKTHNIDLSEFEILTAVAYLYFYENGADFAVMETGLGGRFDATNAVKAPVASVITSISIDHKDRLGDRIEKIASEKAGIIKNGSPVVINADNAGLSVVRECCKNSPLFEAKECVDIKFENGKNYAVVDNESYEFSLWGLHQKQNLSLVLKFVDVLREKGVEIHQNAIKSALKSVYLPARFQYSAKYNIIVDGSHNADAARLLRQNVDFYFPNTPCEWVYGVLSTKEYDKVVNILFREGDVVNLVEFNNSCSVSPDAIESVIRNKNSLKIKKFYKTANTLNYFSSTGLMIVTGSFYMIGELFYQKSDFI